MAKNNKYHIKKKIIIESILVFFVAIVPFLYKIHDYLPSGDPEDTISFLGLTIGSNGFNNVSSYIWFLTGKIIPLYLLIFWFFTSRDWWYHIIIIPIAMFAFQIFEVVYYNDEFVDTENIWWLIPICSVVIPLVYFIRVKLYDKHVHGIDLEAMQLEINSLKEKEDAIEKIKDPEQAFKALEKSTEEIVPNKATLSISEEVDE